MERRLLAIVGPTATGKTEVGVRVAEALEGEIVSADSMQVYRGMDIGTAKPTPEQRERVPHHLVDILDPNEEFSVADYRARADAAIEDIWSRGKQPVLVGGSGFYVRALIEEMDFSAASPNAELRARLEAEAEAKGVEALHARLAEVDPRSAERIHPNDKKRIIRAIEVYEQTGEPMSARRRQLDRAAAARYNVCEYGLFLPRRELYRRIEERIDRMMEAGLAEEAERLLSQGYGEDLVAMKGLGYAQLAPYVRGAVTLEEAVRLLKRDTRRFAKRQMTWFRSDARVEWLNVREAGGPEGAAESIVRKWRRE